MISIFPKNVLYHLNNCGCYTVLFFCRTRYHLGNAYSLRRNMLYRQREETELLYTLPLQHNTQGPEQISASVCTHVCMHMQTGHVCICTGSHTYTNLLKRLQFLCSIFFASKDCVKKHPPSNLYITC